MICVLKTSCNMNDKFMYTVTSEEQTKKCLLFNTNTTLSSFVALDSTIRGSFICANKVPLYTFSCHVHGHDLLWYFNEVGVATFLYLDRPGLTFHRSYPESGPVYNITTFFGYQNSLDIFGSDRIPLLTSVMTIEPFNENEFTVLPFRVSCHTHCQDINRTAYEVCQTKQYEVTGML